MKRQLIGLTVLVVMGISLSQAQNTAPRDMTLIDMLELSGVSSLQQSPDGKSIVFKRDEANWKKNRRTGDLWRIGADGKNLTQLTFDPAEENSPNWLPDSSAIIFSTKRGEDKTNQLYLMPMSGGESKRISDHHSDIQDFQIAPDGKTIFFVSNTELPESFETDQKQGLDISPFEEALTYRLIYKLNIADGKISQVSENDIYVRSFTLSNDGSLIAFQRTPGLTIDDGEAGEIWTMPSSGGKATQVTNNDFSEGGVEISPDNKTISFHADVDDAGAIFLDNNLFTVPVTGGTPKLWLRDAVYGIDQSRWSADGRHIFFVANMGVHTQLWSLNIADGKATQLTAGKHAISGWNYQAATKSHALIISGSENPGDIYTLAMGANALQPVTTFNADLKKKFNIPRQEAITWKSDDGTQIEGLLSYPINYKAGKKYPLVVITHGGPRSSDHYGQWSWGKYIPVLAAKGYAVLMPNYRGGTGYGDKFILDMLGKYFRNAHLDVMTGVDHLIAQGIADPDRLIKAGWSAGGHMTNKIITHTNRFKAAASGAGAVEWMSMYGESDTRINRSHWFGGSPWQKDAPLESFRETSHIQDLWKVKTPTIVFVGKEDVRVPPTQSMLLFRGLRANGVPTQLYMAPREGHGWQELRHRLTKMNAELGWFEKYAMGRDYEWARPPKGQEPEASAESGADAGGGGRRRR